MIKQKGLVFKPVNSQNNFPKMEEKVLKKWKSQDLFNKIQELRKNESSNQWTWLEGPPTANGLPHAGHALTRTLKDIILRFRTMEGFYVRPRIGGWDCHGLPVELEVEKELGFTKKQDIEDFGIKKFNQLCKTSVLKYEKEWREMTERIGFWLDLDHPYITMSDNYIESVWWSLKELYNKNLLYKGVRVAPLCTRCGTTLSSHELAQGYKEVVDPSVFVKFDSVDFDGIKFLAWTTTPWTLLSNVMLSVNPDITYVVVNHDGEKLLLAKELVEKVFGEKKKVLKTYKGKDLEFKKYVPLFPYFADTPGNAFIVTLADYVTIENGTGIVHSAPAFGADDAETGRKYKAPIIQCVDLEGKFTADVPPLEGIWVKDADKKIIKMLKEDGKLFKKESYKHSYPHCWRCKTPLLYYGTESWFIEMSRLRENLTKNNEQIHWQPDYIKHGRFGNFLENVVDWNLSRSRYWGTPLPIWICTDCGKTEVVGSKADLIERVGKLPEEFELHRPWIDEVKWDCADCGKEMIREKYVIDVWYDSGSAPFAQYHYPFENVEEFENDFPFNWITEAIDQTRGWFYSLLAVNTALFDKPAYISSLCMEHVLDDNGKKMSKSLRNTTNPDEVFDKVGADAVRWYLSRTPAWNQTRFSIELTEEAQRKMLNTLWNVYSFFVTNINVDEYEPVVRSKVADRAEIDQWIISRLQEVIEEVRDGLETLTIHKAVLSLDYFIIEEVSNWYLRRSRRRFYTDELDDDKKYAYDTLYEVLRTLSLLLAPIMPFTSEEMFLNLNRDQLDAPIESVHAQYFPKPDDSLLQIKLNKKMGVAINAAIAGRAARSLANIKMRQPLELAVISLPQESPDLGELLQVVAGELNVKSVSSTTSDEYIDYSVLPNLKLLAPKLKSKITELKSYLQTLPKTDARKIVEEMKANGTVTITLGNDTWEFTADEINVGEISKEGFSMGSSRGVTVFVKTKITKELELEGLAREIVRRIQDMRKSADLAFTDKIILLVETKSNNLKQAFKKHSEYILSETQTVQTVKTMEAPDFEQEWDIGSEKLLLKIKKSER